MTMIMIFANLLEKKTEMIPLHEYSYPFLGHLKFSSGALISLVDVTTLRVELNGWQIHLNEYDLDRHTPLRKGLTADKCISEQKPSPEVKRTACRAHKQVRVKPHI